MKIVIFKKIKKEMGGFLILKNGIFAINEIKCIEYDCNTNAVNINYKDNVSTTRLVFDSGSMAERTFAEIVDQFKSYMGSIKK